MKHKIVRDSVLTASTVLLVSGFIKLLPNLNPKLFVIAGTLGLTGTALVKKENNPELEPDITVTIKQQLAELSEQKISSLEQQVEQAKDLVDGKIEAANNKILVLEQNIKEILDSSDLDRHEILDIIDQEIKAELQEADDKIFALEQKIKEIPNFAEQELIDLVDRELEISALDIDDKIIAFEQKAKKLIEKSIDEANNENTSARDKLEATLERKIAQFQASINSPKKSTASLGIIELLKLQGVVVEANRIKYDSKQSLLSKHIAKNYDSLQNFSQQLIKNVKDNQAFEYSLKHKHHEDIISHTFLGAELKNLGFYPGYKYQGKNVKTMSIPVCKEQVKKKLLNFLQGGWFEVYILAQAIKYLKRKNINNKKKKRELLKYSFLLNPYASFYKKNDSKLYRKHELDILLLIKNHLIWIECKSGKVLDTELQKYSDNNQQFLRIPKQNALVVCFKISDSDAALKTKQYPGITVINPDSLVESLATILNNKPIPLPAAEIVDRQLEDGALTTVEDYPVKVIPANSLEVLTSTVNKPKIVKQSLKV